MTYWHLHFSVSEAHWGTRNRSSIFDFPVLFFLHRNSHSKFSHCHPRHTHQFKLSYPFTDSDSTCIPEMVLAIFSHRTRLMSTFNEIWKLLWIYENSHSTAITRKRICLRPNNQKMNESHSVIHVATVSVSTCLCALLRLSYAYVNLARPSPAVISILAGGLTRTSRQPPASSYFHVNLHWFF